MWQGCNANCVKMLQSLGRLIVMVTASQRVALLTNVAATVLMSV